MTATTSLPLTDAQALGCAAAGHDALPDLLAMACSRRDRLFGRTVTFSPKAFVPLTNLCRNRCDYCSFRKSPFDAGAHTMANLEVTELLSTAAQAGCSEALICIGDKPEKAFSAYRQDLSERGHADTVRFIDWASRQALAVGMLPHTNAGVLSRDDMALLRQTNVSLGLMLENVSSRLCDKGMPHHRAPDKRPQVRLAMLREAGQLRIATTTGILVGIGETRRERVQSLLAIRQLHRSFGHIQEVIVQNFVPRADIAMASVPGPGVDDLSWTIAMARLILDDDVALQAPPNLNGGRLAQLVAAGINDLGGISPVTIDFINPHNPWPVLTALRDELAGLGFELKPRLPIYDAYLSDARFVVPELRERALALQGQQRVFGHRERSRAVPSEVSL